MHCLEVYYRLTQLSGSSLFILTYRSHDFDGMSTVVSVAPVVRWHRWFGAPVALVALGASAVV